jgi:chemotaxis protein CheX
METAVQHIETNFVGPFVDSALKTFATMLDSSVTRKEVYIKKNHTMFGDITGTIGLSGTLSGSASLSFPAPVAVYCVQKLLGADTAEEITHDDIQDCVGEIVNMVAGGAKTVLHSTEYNMDFTLPTIVSGRGHELYHRPDITDVSVIFELESVGEFALDVCIASK